MRWDRLGFGVKRARRSERRVVVKMLLGLVRWQFVVVLECRPGLLQVVVFVGRLPVLRRLRRFNSGARGRRIVPADLRPAPDGTEGLSFRALDFGGVCATPALQVEVLADRVV